MRLSEDKDDIIESQHQLIEKLRANLIRYEGVISNLEEENKQLKAENEKMGGLVAKCNCLSYDEYENGIEEDA